MALIGCSETFGAHGDSLAAPSVSGHDEPLTGDDQVGGGHPSVEGGLPGSVPVVEHELHLGVVDIEDRELEDPVLGHGPEPLDAGGGLLVGGLDAGKDILPGGVDHGDEVRAVVYDEIGRHVQNGVEIVVVLLLRLPFLGVDVEAVLLPERHGDGVVGGQRVAAREPDLRSGIRQRDRQHPGLGLGVQSHADLQAGEGLLVHEALAYVHEDGHVVLGPVEPEGPFLG